jgi:hypothetical protein
MHLGPIIAVRDPTEVHDHRNPTLPLPEANTELTKYVDPDVDNDGAVGPGCYYTGATRIMFPGTTMRVFSPNTSPVDTPSRCLTSPAGGSSRSSRSRR